MDSFEYTKIGGAILAALLLIFGAKTLIETRLEHSAQKIGYSLGGPEAPAEKAVEKAEAPKKDAAAPAKEAAAAPAKEAAPAAPAKDVAKDVAPAKDAAAPAKPAAPAKETAAAHAKDAAPAAAPAKDAAPAIAAADPSAAPAKEAAAPAAATAAGNPVVALLSKASTENGQAIFKKCTACHTYEKGKPKAIGPNLWGIVNRPKASSEGFEYSAGVKALGGNWTFDDLAQWVTNPKSLVAQNKMVFAGISNPADAADLVAYLATLADTPVALPK